MDLLKKEVQSFITMGNNAVRKGLSEEKSGSIAEAISSYKDAMHCYVIASGNHSLTDDGGLSRELLMITATMVQCKLEELAAKSCTRFAPVSTSSLDDDTSTSISSGSSHVEGRENSPESSSIGEGSELSSIIIIKENEKIFNSNSGAQSPSEDTVSSLSHSATRSEDICSISLDYISEFPAESESDTVQDFENPTTRLHAFDREAAWTKREQSSKGEEDENCKQYFIRAAEGRPSVTFADIVGLNSIKALLVSTLFSDPDSRYRRLVTTGSKRPNILFYGYPGCGKTEIVRAYVNCMKQATLFPITASDLMSKWIGESEKMLKALLHVAEAMSPSVIFIDEVDSLLGGEKENKWTTNFVSEFLIRVEKLQNVQVLAASNYPWRLHAAMIRRFQYVVQVPLPSQTARLGIIKKYLGTNADLLSDSELRQLSKLSDSFSASDLKRALNYAALLPTLVTQRAEFFKKITTAEGIFYTPCNSADPQREKKCFSSLSPQELILPRFSFEFARHALKTIKSSVDPKEESTYNKQMREFNRKFGHDLYFVVDDLLSPAVIRTLSLIGAQAVQIYWKGDEMNPFIVMFEQSNFAKTLV